MRQKSSHFFNPIAFSSPYTRYALIIIRFLITLRNISTISKRLCCIHAPYQRVTRLHRLTAYATKDFRLLKRFQSEMV